VIYDDEQELPIDLGLTLDMPLGVVLGLTNSMIVQWVRDHMDWPEAAHYDYGISIANEVGAWARARGWDG
jgi:hypothetical protein